MLHACTYIYIYIICIYMWTDNIICVYYTYCCTIYSIVYVYISMLCTLNNNYAIYLYITIIN